MPRRWDAVQIPGMRRLPVADPMYDRSWARAHWQPLPDEEYKINARCQPYIKLHGSSNWITEEGAPMLIIGGNKDEAIQVHPILRRYASEFSTRLNSPTTRVMVIGYGFKDHHINRVIAEVVHKHDLKMFVVSPRGRELAKVLSSTVHPGIPLMVHKYDLENVFQQSLIGVSQRPLRQTFGEDGAEYRKIQKFFEA